MSEFKKCKKCQRELPISNIYFSKDKACKDGHRSVCRECSREGKFLSENYVPAQRWTNEEEELLKQVYRDYTNAELIAKFFPTRKSKSLQDKALYLGVSGKTEEVKKRVNIEKSINHSGENSANYGRKFSKEVRQKMSEGRKGKYLGEDSYWFGRKRSEEQREKCRQITKSRGLWVGDKNPRHKNPMRGKENPNWKGGITPLYFELRSECKQWIQDSIKACNYKCVITGTIFDDIHHLYSFREIVNECFDILGIDPRSKVLDYTEDEFNLIKDKLRELHEAYGLGVCLNHHVHKFYHDTYGYKNNTQDQFEDFKERLKSGEFDKFLNENNFTLII